MGQGRSPCCPERDLSIDGAGCFRTPVPTESVQAAAPGLETGASASLGPSTGDRQSGHDIFALLRGLVYVL